MSGAAGGKTSSFSSSAPAGVQDLVERGIISQTGSDVLRSRLLVGDDDDEEDHEEYSGGSESPLSLPSSMMNSDEDFIIGNTDDAAASADLRARIARMPTSSTFGAVVGGGAGSGVAGNLALLHAQLAEAQKEKDLLLTDLQRERQRYHDDVVALREQRRSEMKAVREKQIELEAEIPVLRSHMKQARDEFRELEISSAAYEELRRMPEEKLTLREFVVVRVHRMLQEARDEAERARLAADTMRREYASAAEEAQRRALDDAQRVRAAEEREALLRNDIEALEAAGGERARRLAAATADVQELRSKGEAYDRLAARESALQREVEGLRSAAALAEESVASLRKEKDDAHAKLLDAAQRIEVLEVDKSYLEREGDARGARVSSLEAELAREREMTRELRAAKVAFHEELVKEKDDARRGYEARLSAEVQRLAEKSEAEMARLRETSEDVYERQNATLRQAKVEATEAARAAEMRLRELSAAHEELQLRAVKADSDHQAQLAELRGQLKMKAFELERSRLTMDEQGTTLKQSQVEMERMAARFDVLREEFAKLEASGARDRIEMEAQLAVERERVSGYEQLEIELDRAVVGSASGDGSGSGGGDGEGEGYNLAMPIHARRRVKQSIALAQKLIKAQNKCRELESSLVRMEDENMALRAQLGAAERAVDGAGQPHQYFVSRIREQEAETLQHQRTASTASRDLAHSQDECNRLRGENGRLKVELQKLLGDRRQLDALREAVETLKNDGRPGGETVLHGGAAPTSNSNSSSAAMPDEPLVREVGSNFDALRTSAGLVTQRIDAKGAPLPKWYVKLRHQRA
eukprot:g1490.t1